MCDALEVGAELESQAAKAFALRLSHSISMNLIGVILCDEKNDMVIPDADAISPKNDLPTAISMLLQYNHLHGHSCTYLPDVQKEINSRNLE